ncbi:hypothetical protein ARMGADRAFT_1027064 [Armillaria gallica]|uniref:Uncharacterized protein n=1 Tax=Armillaria gallica TaxID=47427 RepID=A0A2H3DQT7_ARMGA|nr:hypothetical protein ARMGADRAFT_1027064 [Armillaria gallica]
MTSNPGAHQHQTTTAITKPTAEANELNRNVRTPPGDPWAGTDDHQVEPDPKYPAILHWLEENISAIFHEWDQPVGHEHLATFELPDLPPERDAVPSYWVQMAEELPWAHARPL